MDKKRWDSYPPFNFKQTRLLAIIKRLADAIANEWPAEDKYGKYSSFDDQGA